MTIIGGSSEQEAVWDLGDDKISIKCEFVSLHKTKVTWFKDDKVSYANISIIIISAKRKLKFIF